MFRSDEASQADGHALGLPSMHEALKAVVRQMEAERQSMAALLMSWLTILLGQMKMMVFAIVVANATVTAMLIMMVMATIVLTTNTQTPKQITMKNCPKWWWCIKFVSLYIYIYIYIYIHTLGSKVSGAHICSP